MNKKIISSFLTAILLFSFMISTGLIVKPVESNPVYETVEVTKLIKTSENEWVNETQVEVGETVHFKITVTYHDTDGIGIGRLLTYINITENLPEGLEYQQGTATIEETSIDDQKIIWRFGGLILYDNESVEIEFDTTVTTEGEIENHVDVEAMESCYKDPRYNSAKATLFSSYNHDFKQKDVDDDCQYERAIDQNDDSSDGYEYYEDNLGDPSEAKKSKDGDGDGMIDHFIDINNDEKPDKYWDPDDDILTDIIIKDVDYNESDNWEEEWVFDSDDDGELDKYYDPDDDQIYDYIVFELEKNIVGNGTINVNPGHTIFLKDSEVILNAMPDTNWSFDNWESNGVINGSTKLTETVIMNEDKTITAYFKQGEPEKYKLTVKTEGQGEVNISPKQDNYTEGTIVTLTATPETGWYFDEWTNDATDDNNPLEILMDSDKNITAVFKEANNDDTKKPFVNITKPKKNTRYKNNEEKGKSLLITKISGSIDIEAEAYDESGIEKVEFYIGDDLKHSDKDAPYNYYWNESNLLLKIKTIKVKAYDNAGNSNTSEILVLKTGSLYKYGKYVFGATAVLFLISRLSNKPTEEEKDDSEDGTTLNKPPVAKAEGPSSSQTNKKITFDASDSYDPEEEQLEYIWDFGDGNAANGKQVEHIYKQKGTYAVTLTVKDSKGSTDTITLNIEIKNPEQSETDNTFWIIAGTLGAILTSIVAVFFVRRKLYV